MPKWFTKAPEVSPQVGQENQFGSSRGLRFGPLRINKTGITANNGTVNSVTLDAEGLHGFNSSGVETIAITPSGAIGYGTDYTAWQFTDAPGGTIKGAMGYDSSTSSYTIIGTTSKLQLGTLSGYDAFYTSSDDLFIAAGIGGTGVIYLSDNGGGANEFHIDGATSIYEDGLGSTVIDCGGSTKTAIVKTSQGYNALYCTESPEVWFMDFARVKKSWKFWKKEYIVDKMFLEVTEAPFIAIPTMNKGIVQIWGKRKGFSKVRFEPKTEKEFTKNNNFWDKSKITVKINK